MFIRLLKTASLVSLTLLAACATDVTTEDELGGVNDNSESIEMPQHEIDLVVQFLNAPTTSIDLLDAEVGLDRRAAENLVYHRNGLDGAYPSEDDNPYDNLEEVDRVAYVGNSALLKLRDYTVAHPPAQAEIVEGVQFSSEQSAAVVWGVNHASLEELDVTVGLTSSAANGLIDNAPYTSVTEMGAVINVGPAALASLRNHAARWGAEMAQPVVAQAGNYDGVEFDEQTAQIALSIANSATELQLTQQGNLWSGGAQTVVENRPYATLRAVSDTYGVGKTTMRQLHDYALSGQFKSSGTPAQN